MLNKFSAYDAKLKKKIKWCISCNNNDNNNKKKKTDNNNYGKNNQQFKIKEVNGRIKPN